MDSKYEYEDDDDFWYEKDEELEVIDDIEEPQINVDQIRQEDIPQVPSNTNLDFTQELPDVFKKTENIAPINEPITQIPNQQPNNQQPISNLSNENSNLNMQSSFSKYNTPLEVEDELEKTIIMNEPINNVAEPLIERRILPKEPEEQLDLTKGNELKVGIVILVILISAIFILPWVYSLFN